MTKEELKPIDVSKYKVTETGQVLKMTKDELAKKADTNHALVSQLAELEAENAELKRFIKDLIHENSNLCFQFSNTTCLFNSDYKNRAEELIGERL